MRRIAGFLLIIIGIFALIFLSTSSGSGSFSNFWNKFTKDINEEQRFNIEQLRNITIETTSTNVQLVRTTEQEASIKLTGSITGTFNKEVSLAFDVNGDHATIGVSQNKWNVGFGINNVKLLVELPEKAWDNVSILGKSSNISVEHLEANELDINTNSGNITLASINSNTLSASANSGNIKLDEVVGDKFGFNTNSGNITTSSLDTSDIVFYSKTGNVTIDGTNYKVDGTTSSGNIKLLASSIMSSSNLQANSGNIKVELREEPTDLSLEFNANSGKGSVRADGFTYQFKDSKKHSFKGAFGSGRNSLAVKTNSGNFTLTN